MHLIDNLLNWYDVHQRQLPWRALPSQKPNPYHVWLSEVMLQQTTVQTVKSYFEDFTKRWPTVNALAAAPLDDVLHAWQGLGYYARARNLHRCAKEVSARGIEEQERKQGGAKDGERKGAQNINQNVGQVGEFPQARKELESLSGIGPYTAAAIAAIAFNEQELPVDGNIKRVLARVFAIEVAFKDLHAYIDKNYKTLACHGRPGDFAQALMDLGSTICKPKTPLCDLCPLQQNCQAFKDKTQGLYPKAREKLTKPVRYARTKVVIDPLKSALLVQRRPQKGLLGGMIEIPSEPWQTVECLPDLPKAQQGYLGRIKHTFTHFHLYFDVFKIEVRNDDCSQQSQKLQTIEREESYFCPLDQLGSLALPTLYKKVLKLLEKQPV